MNLISLLALVLFLLLGLHAILVFLFGGSRSHELDRLGFLNQIVERVLNMVHVVHRIYERLDLRF